MKNPASKEKTSPIHSTFRWSILLYQVFGFMPLNGIFAQDISEVKFSWKSARTIYALLTTAGFAFLSCLQLVRFSLYPVQMTDILRLWYFLKSLGTSIFFIHIARGWKEFVHEWAQVDGAMRGSQVLRELKKQATVINAIFMVLFAVDYVLIQLQRVASDLPMNEMVMDIKIWNYYQKDLRFSYVYQLFHYDFFSGILLLIVQFQVLICGTFLDVFIILISVCLATRMRQITNRTKLISQSHAPNSVWMELREDYNRLERLCKFVNSKIGSAILISFTGNLGIILVQLFNSLKARKTVIGKLYLYYVFAFLLTKTIAVCLVGSKVNDESKKPLAYLYSSPDVVYNVEIDRMIRQISRNVMALSGMRLFYIRKNLVLKIAGSIVTYELVLIQFAGDFLKEHEIANRTTSL